MLCPKLAIRSSYLPKIKAFNYMDRLRKIYTYISQQYNGISLICSSLINSGRYHRIL